MYEEVRRRIEEVIARIDELASGKRLRAAQRRALWRCRSKLDRMRRKLGESSDEEQKELVGAVVEMLPHICELVQAYFCRGSERKPTT